MSFDLLNSDCDFLLGVNDTAVVEITRFLDFRISNLYVQCTLPQVQLKKQPLCA